MLGRFGFSRHRHTNSSTTQPPAQPSGHTSAKTPQRRKTTSDAQLLEAWNTPSLIAPLGDETTESFPDAVDLAVDLTDMMDTPPSGEDADSTDVATDAKTDSTNETADPSPDELDSSEAEPQTTDISATDASTTDVSTTDVSTMDISTMDVSGTEPLADSLDDIKEIEELGFISLEDELTEDQSAIKTNDSASDATDNATDDATDQSKDEIDQVANEDLARDSDEDTTTELTGDAVVDGELGGDDEVVALAIAATEPQFQSGTFTVGESGKVSITWLFDGGGYRGEAGIFSLTGLEAFEAGSEDFMREVATRVLSESEAGHVVLRDRTDAALLTGELGYEANFNDGEFQGTQTFAMTAGDTFGMAIVPHGSFATLLNHPTVGGSARPLFSMVTANPNDAFQMGQLVDLTGDANVFAFEDLRLDGKSDRDYNDIVLQVTGAVAQVDALADEYINPERDWRDSAVGQELIDYVARGGETDPEPDPVPPPIAPPPGTGLPTNPEDALDPPPFSAPEILRDDWTRSVAYDPAELRVDSTVPMTVDPAEVVRVEPGDRALTQWGELEDGNGSATTLDPGDPNTLPSNQRPVVTALQAERVITPGQSISIAALLTASDPDGDAIQQYWFKDTNPRLQSGYFTLNGQSSPSLVVSAEELSSVRFVGGSQSSIDGIKVSVDDGQGWISFPEEPTIKIITNNPPNVIPNPNYRVGKREPVDFSKLFSIFDLDGDDLSKYEYKFYETDKLTNSGSFDDFNDQTVNMNLSIKHNELQDLKFISSEEAGKTETLTVYAFDGKAWGRPVTVVINPPDSGSGDELTDEILLDKELLKEWQNNQLKAWQNNHAPRVIVKNEVLTEAKKSSDWDGRIKMSELFDVEDKNGDEIQIYGFYDRELPSASTYNIALNGEIQAGSVYINADQLDDLELVEKKEGHDDDDIEILSIMAFDGRHWGHYSYLLTNPYPIKKLDSINYAPVVTAKSLALKPGEIVNASSLFTVSDVNDDEIQIYYFYDEDAREGSGYFKIGEEKQSRAININGRDLKDLEFVAGETPGTIETIQVSSFDGRTWSKTRIINIATVSEDIENPIQPRDNITIDVETGRLKASDLFEIDPDQQDKIKSYYFIYDYDNGFGGYGEQRDVYDHDQFKSGYLSLKGVPQYHYYFEIAADELKDLEFLAGQNTGIETIKVQAFDGTYWHSPIDLHIKTLYPNQRPTVYAENQTAFLNQIVSPVFTVDDPEDDPITHYAFFDYNQSTNSGYFTLDNIKQPDEVITIAADQLKDWRWVGGSTAIIDDLYIAAYDGQTWSAWANYKTTTQNQNAPTITFEDNTFAANTAGVPKFSAQDPNGDSITGYEFFDSNAQSLSGYFTVNGVQQPAGQRIFVPAGQRDTVKFVGGADAISDPIAIRAATAKDGWGNWYFSDFKTTESNFQDWFSENLSDRTIQSLARARFIDGDLSRQDMIDIFDSAKDEGSVTTDEFADLQTLVNNTDTIQMAEHVRVLGHKVANGSLENAFFQGQSLGNLSADSEANHLQKLIDKHFFGKDLPTLFNDYQSTFVNHVANQAAYNYVQGNLFENGVHYTDVRQGVLADCYYLSALAGTALADPESIKNTFIDNGDDTYTVRFFHEGQPDYVTVNHFLPINPNGTLPFAKVGNPENTYVNPDNELWVALLEKAYAQANAAGWSGQDGTNSYAGIQGGQAQLAVEQLTNLSGTYHPLAGSSVNEATTAFASGSIVFFSSRSNQDGASIGTQTLVGDHAYVLTSYDASAETVTLFNPQNTSNSANGDGYLTVNWSEIPTYFDAWRQAA